jgi:AbrB family looped-hinge helix DNA binding protein
MALLTVSSKGWVVIPAELRKKYQLKPGSQVRIVDYGGVLALVPVLENPIKQTRGILKGKSSLTKALLEERAKDKQREDQRVR